MTSKFQVGLSKQAHKKFISLSLKDQKKIAKAIIVLETDPLSNLLNIKKLAGTTNSWRVRVGDLRILYTFNQKFRIVEIIKIDFRGSVYA